jgi:hypothetical protein
MLESGGNVSTEEAGMAASGNSVGLWSRTGRLLALFLLALLLLAVLVLLHPMVAVHAGCLLKTA